MVPAGKKILLIDDQWDSSLFVAFQQEGYEVIACQSPQKAWGVVWTFQPHFIIVHLTNLSRGGFATLQGCGVLAGGAPIIIAVPLSGCEAVMNALKGVAAAFLPLPVRPHAIRKILDALEQSNRRREKRASATSER